MAKKRTKPRTRHRTRTTYLVFVSHATNDKQLAKILCEKIEACNAQTFRDDRDIQGGDDIPEEIQEKIRRCDEFVVLLTPESIARPWVLLEIGMAVILRKRVVPIVQHVDVNPIPAMIKSVRNFDFNDLERYLTQLARRAVKR